jgi:hypothetical protein
MTSRRSKLSSTSLKGQIRSTQKREIRRGSWFRRWRRRGRFRNKKMLCSHSNLEKGELKKTPLLLLKMKTKNSRKVRRRKK